VWELRQQQHYRNTTPACASCSETHRLARWQVGWQRVVATYLLTAALAARAWLFTIKRVAVRFFQDAEAAYSGVSKCFSSSNIMVACPFIKAINDRCPSTSFEVKQCGSKDRAIWQFRNCHLMPQASAESDI